MGNLDDLLKKGLLGPRARTQEEKEQEALQAKLKIERKFKNKLRIARGKRRKLLLRGDAARYNDNRREILAKTYNRAGRRKKATRRGVSHIGVPLPGGSASTKEETLKPEE
jgi:hypothetical protein